LTKRRGHLQELLDLARSRAPFLAGSAAALKT